MKKFNLPSLLCGLVLSYFLFVSTSFAYVVMNAKVHSIYDGDTIRVELEGEEKLKSVRFKGIDTPEIDHNGHSQGEAALAARDFLRSLVPIGEQVQLKILKNEVKARRLYAQVIYRGLDVNKELLKNGLAVTYILAPFDEQVLSEYVAALAYAVDHQLGLYDSDFRSKQDQQNLVEPYIFRLQAVGKTGHYLIGDISSKKLYESQDIQQIAVYNRIFFHNLEMAQRSGYDF